LASIHTRHEGRSAGPGVRAARASDAVGRRPSTRSSVPVPAIPRPARRGAARAASVARPRSRSGCRKRHRLDASECLPLVRAGV